MNASKSSVISRPSAAAADLKALCNFSSMLIFKRLTSFIDVVVAMALTSFPHEILGAPPPPIDDTHILITILILHPLSTPPKTPPEFQQDLDLTTDQTGVFNSTLSRDIALPVNAIIDSADNLPMSEVQAFKEPALPWYTDQILPFDITLAAANEYGAAASAKIFGVELLNEGFGTSVDDSVLESQATFVAFPQRESTTSSFTLITQF